VTRRATVAAIRAEEDTVGQPKVRDSYTQRNDQGTLYKTLLGHPYHVSRNVPALGSTGDLIVGDFGMYQFLMRQDLRIDVSDAPGWTTDQMAIRLIARADGMPGTPFAFKMLKGAVS
jgi:HK97 family phage major capsid protein